MSSLSRPRYVCRLSPNEEAAALHKQRNDRRKARLLQVRKQEKGFAKSLREEVKSKKEQERIAIQEHLDAALIASHEDELRELESRYLSRMGQMGKGHSDAQHIYDEHNRVQELRLLLEAEQRWCAQERHKSAMRELTSNKLVEKEAKQHSLKSRQKALEVEKERAKHVATTKPHATQPLIMDLVVGKGRRVHLKEAEGYASTYYHIPNTVVRRVDSPDWNKQPNANEMAQAKAEENEMIQKHLVASHQEQLEKARLRHKHALAKVKLEKEKGDVLTQLKTLERQDRAHRQKSLAKMPVNLFQPAHRRGEIISEQERDMEQAFEKLFVKTHGTQAHAQLALSQLANEPSSGNSLEDLESSKDGELSDHLASTLVNNGRLKDHPQTQPLLQVKPHSDDDEHSVKKHEPTDKLVPLQNTTGGSKSPIVIPHTEPSNLRPNNKPKATSPDLYDSNYSSASLTTPTDYTPSYSDEPSRNHVFKSLDSISAPLPLPYPTSQIPPYDQVIIQPHNQTLEDSEAISESHVYTSHKPTVKFSLAPTFHSASSGSPGLYIPSTQHSRMPIHSQQSPLISPSLPQPPDLSITAMTSLNTQESSSSFVDTSRNTSVRETDHPVPIRAPSGSTSTDPQQLEPTRAADRRGATDGMQKLVSMIRTQHQAWNKRLVARSNLLSSQRVSSSSSSSLSSSSSSHPLSQVHTATTQANNDESKAQDHSLSVFTLSTRDSTVSPQDITLPHRNPEHPFPSSHVAVPSFPPHSQSDDSSTSTSPEPLSISGYHTTLEMSSVMSPAVQPPPETNHNLHLVQQQYEARSIPPPRSYSMSTMGYNTTSMAHPAHFSHTPQHTVEHVQSSNVTDSSQADLHIEDIESTESVPYTSPNVRMQPQTALSPIHEDTLSQDVANLPSITTMPSLSYLELPSHLSVPDRPPLPSTNTVDARVLLTPSDLDLSASTNPPSPPSQASPSPKSNMSHSTPSHSRSSSPQLLSPRTPLSPVLRETVRSFDQQETDLRVAKPDAICSDSTSEVHVHEEDSCGQTFPQQLTLGSPGENEQDRQNACFNRHSNDMQYHSDSEELLQEATPHRDHVNKQALTSTSSITTIANEPNKTTTAMATNTSLSLQEAFLKKKEEFIQSSRARLQQLKTAAEKRQTETAPVFNVRGQNMSVKTKQKVSEGCASSSTQGKVVGPVSPGNASLGGGKKAVTFSSPLFQQSHQLKPQGSNHPLILSSQEREKIQKKEMRERNMRFYNRLPEVKRRREEEEKHQTYTANRERAKQYQQKIRSKSMSKPKSQDPKKTTNIITSQDNNQSRKPPFR